jgi:NNP family nitrate/nitrite transporter-like MFS transporter
VAIIQFFLPIIVGGAGAFGLIKASQSGLVLQRAGYLYAALAIIAAVCAYFFMNNLTSAYSKPREQLAVLKYKHTWIMSFLYIGTFGSFIGYSAAMPLLIKINFFRSPIPTESIGINFAYYAFLGALVGSIARPVGGKLADKFGGARVTFWTFIAMIVGTLTVLYTLTLLKPVPVASPEKLALWAKDPSAFPGFSPEIVSAVNHNSDIFPFFLIAFLFVFAATGIGNGSTYRMIPLIWKNLAKGTKATKESSAVIGIAGAIGALGGFLIPITFGSPWVDNPVEAVKTAFAIFTAFYVICLAVTWFFYVRKTATMAKAGV